MCQDESGIESLFSSSEAFTLPEQQYESFENKNGLNGSFKRSEPPTLMSPIQSKRHKAEDEPATTIQPLEETPMLRESISNEDMTLLSALTRSVHDDNLIGDFSRPYALETIQGNHPKLKSISAETMRKLMMGGFEDRVASYKIIDCRYTYEFEGGHIKGAVNLYTHEQILAELNESTEAVGADGKRHILVFHCEFSSKRGPKLLVEVIPKSPTFTVNSHLEPTDLTSCARETDPYTSTQH
jgi:M-phase inducer phosphatase